MNKYISSFCEHDCRVVLRKKIKQVVILCIVLIGTSPALAEIIPVHNFCQRLNNNFSNDYLTNNATRCQQSLLNWSDELDIFEDYAEPVVLIPEGKTDFHVLILSSKWSNAYDISSSTIIEQFKAKGINVKFTLFNYQEDNKQAKFVIDAAKKKKY